MSNGEDLAEKRARLVAAADLERMKLALAWQDIRRRIAPAPEVGRRSRFRPFVVGAIGYAMPLVGYKRMGRILRVAGAAMAIWRATRAWQRVG